MIVSEFHSPLCMTIQKLFLFQYLALDLYNPFNDSIINEMLVLLFSISFSVDVWRVQLLNNRRNTHILVTVSFFPGRMAR